MENDKFHPSHSKLWQKDIAPHLAQIESEGSGAVEQ